MSMAQLALRVPDLEASIVFRRRPSGVEPATLRPGYADLAIAEPPLKRVLLGGDGDGPTRLDHLGVGVGDTGDVRAATARLAESGLETRNEDDTVCRSARQDTVWAAGPGAERWEVYAVEADSATLPGDDGTAECCA